MKRSFKMEQGGQIISRASMRRKRRRKRRRRLRKRRKRIRKRRIKTETNITAGTKPLITMKMDHCMSSKREGEEGDNKGRR